MRPPATAGKRGELTRRVELGDTRFNGRQTTARDDQEERAAQRQELFEALIDEIVINSDDSLTPIFKIPIIRDGQNPDPGDTESDRLSTADAVRALLPMVGDTGIEPVTSSV